MKQIASQRSSLPALSEQPKFLFADSMRAIAIIMVLVIHSGIRYDVSPAFEIPLHALSALSRCCIALFLFLSGFLLAKKEWTAIALFQRCKKILIPYALFSVVAFIYGDFNSIVSPNFVSSLKLLFRFLIGHSFGIYYFVFVILVTYLLHYLVVKFQISYRLVLIFFGIILILHHVIYEPVVMPYVLKSHPKFYDLRIFYDLRFVFWPFFFYLGVLKRSQPNFLANGYRWFSQPIIVTGAGLIFVVMSSHKILNAPNYDSIPCTFWSLIAIATLERYYVQNRLVEFLSAISYFLYLSHILIVYSLRDYVFPVYDLGVAKPFVSFVLSLLIPVLCAYTVKSFGSRRAQRLLGIN